MKNYVLKVVDRDMRTRGGFLWAPVGGVTTAPDWDQDPVCGEGLHGWLNGIGDIICQPWSYDDGAIWLVLEVIGPVVDLNRKVKFQSAKTLFSGSMSDAAGEIVRLSGEQGPVIGVTRHGSDHCTLTGGYCCTLTGGDHSTLTGGYHSTLTGGDHSTLTGWGYSTLTGGGYSTLTGGYCCTLTGGYRSTLTGGDYSTLTGGYCSTLTGGYYSTLTGGYRSTLTGGNRSTLTGGDYSTLTSGDYSTLTGGYCSTLTGGYGSILSIYYYDKGLRRSATAYVGEDGILPGIPYRLNDEFKFEVAE